MKKVTVLSIGISDEYPMYICGEVVTILMPDNYEKDLINATEFPSMPDYKHWDHIVVGLETHQSIAEVKYDVSSQITALYEELKASEFQYDPDVIAGGDYSQEDLVVNYVISKLCRAFSCAFVHNNRA